MKKWSVNLPVPMDGTCNFRDLGGYPANGGTIKKGCFYRSDALHRLSEDDLSWMEEKKITYVLDLRSRSEVEQAPDRIRENFTYYSIPMSDRMNDSQEALAIPERLSDLYITILNTHQEEIKEVMERIAERNGEPVVFHCAVGKDRTGVIAMLLLRLAGVSEEIVIADYSVSAENMKSVFEEQRKILKERGIEISDVLLSSPKEEMEITLDYLDSTWGNAEMYLKECGVNAEDLERLKKILVA